MVAEKAFDEEEVAVPGLSLDTAGEPLVEAADECGASGEKVSMVGNQIRRFGGGGRGGGVRSDRLLRDQGDASRNRQPEGSESEAGQNLTTCRVGLRRMEERAGIHSSLRVIGNGNKEAGLW